MIRLEDGWKQLLADEFDQPYFKALKETLVSEINSGQKVFPLPQHIFEAFNQCPFEKTKVVILGQDPYHSLSPTTSGSFIPHAHGMCFSIQREATKIPPSLQNIYKEIQDELGGSIPNHGNLIDWAKQGVLLLNASLTVRAHQANSHSDIGWHTFTDHVIKKLSEKKDHLVFLLWGNFARSKKTLIDPQKHLILEAAHPSPFSAHSGFFGCGHFSKANTYLEKQGLEPIDWQIKN